jgi:hypothetical protein
MIVWCISTWFSTEPSAYLVGTADVTVASTASEMAMPSEPGHDASPSSICLPILVLPHRARPQRPAWRRPRRHPTPRAGLGRTCRTARRGTWRRTSPCRRSASASSSWRSPPGTPRPRGQRRCRRTRASSPTAPRQSPCKASGSRSPCCRTPGAPPCWACASRSATRPHTCAGPDMQSACRTEAGERGAGAGPGSGGVLVIDLRTVEAEGLLEVAGAVQRRRAPLPVYVQNGLGDFVVALLGDLRAEAIRWR